MKTKYPTNRNDAFDQSVTILGTSKSLIAAGLFSLVIAPLSFATFPLTEAFEYPASSEIALKQGGQGWAGAWSEKIGNGAITTTSRSLSYPGIKSKGGKLYFNGVANTGKNTFLFRNLETPLAEGNTYYIRFLAKNINEGRQYFGLALYSQDAEQFLIGQSSYSPNWTVNRLAGLPNSAGVLVSNVDSSAPSLLVVKLEMRPGAERVTFWVNPNLSLLESKATPQGGSFFTTMEDFGSIDAVRIGGGGYREGVNPTDHFMDEIYIDRQSPFAGGRDADGDGLNNYEETIVHKTNPSKPDTDGDGIKDGVEVADGTNPLAQDSDRDGLKDGKEKRIGTNPLKKDTDRDQFSDGEEVLERDSDPTVFNKAITSSLTPLKLRKGRPMARYRVTSNIGARIFKAQGLPPGLDITKAGFISGAATKAGIYRVTLTARKSARVSVRARLTIRVL